MMDSTSSTMPLVERVRGRLFEAIRSTEQQANKQFFAELASEGSIGDDAQRAAFIRATVQAIRASLQRLRDAGLGPKLYRREATRVLDWWQKKIDIDPRFADMNTPTGRRGYVRKTLTRIIAGMLLEVSKDAAKSEKGFQVSAQEKVAETIAGLVKSMPLMNVFDFAMNLMGKQGLSTRINQGLARVLGAVGFGGALARSMGAGNRLTTLDVEELRAQQAATAEAKTARSEQFAAMRTVEEQAPIAQRIPLQSADMGGMRPVKMAKASTSGRGFGVGGDSDMIVESIFMVYDSLEKTITPILKDIYNFMVDARNDDLRAKDAADVSARLSAEAAPVVTADGTVISAQDVKDKKTKDEKSDKGFNWTSLFAGFSNTLFGFRSLWTVLRTIPTIITGGFGAIGRFLGFGTEIAGAGALGMGRFAKFGKMAKGGGILAAAMSPFLMMERMSEGQTTTQAVVGGGAEALGGWGGALAGAALGSALGPVGTVVGGLAGGLLGSKAMGSAADWLMGVKKPEPQPLNLQKPQDTGDAGKRRRYIEQSLRSAGYSNEQVAGIVANLKSENSKFDPAQGGDNGNAIGIAQWNGPRRRRVLAEQASQPGVDPLQVQTGFLIKELAEYHLSPSEMPKSANEAAQVVLRKFENPREDYRIRRSAEYAQQFASFSPQTMIPSVPLSRQASPIAAAAAAQSGAPIFVVNAPQVTAVNASRGAAAPAPVLYLPMKTRNDDSGLQNLQSINALF